MTNKTATKGIAMDAVDVLMEARAYIEKGWCRAQLRRWRGNGRAQTPREPYAWCAIGAIREGAHPGWLVGRWKNTPLTSAALTLLSEANGIGSVAPWNDKPGRTQAEVLEAFDRAIELGLDREHGGYEE